MSCDILLLPDITPELANQLHAMGLHDSDKLLTAVSTPAMRADLAQRLQVSQCGLLALGRTAELIRIRGIGSVYADILLHAGIGSVAELAACDPERLYSRLKVHAIERVVYRTPGVREVRRWVAEARSMDSSLQV